MDIKEYAQSRNLKTLKVAKKLCVEILGSIPEFLTEQQLQALDAHLLASTQALLPQTENVNLEVPEESVDKVIEIVGVSTLKKNFTLYQQYVLRGSFETLQSHHKFNANIEQVVVEEMRKSNHQLVQNISNAQLQLAKDTAAIMKEYMSVPDINIDLSKDPMTDLTEEQKEWLRLELEII